MHPESNKAILGNHQSDHIFFFLFRTNRLSSFEKGRTEACRKAGRFIPTLSSSTKDLPHVRSSIVLYLLRIALTSTAKSLQLLMTVCEIACLCFSVRSTPSFLCLSSCLPVLCKQIRFSSFPYWIFPLLVLITVWHLYIFSCLFDYCLCLFPRNKCCKGNDFALFASDVAEFSGYHDAMPQFFPSQLWEVLCLESLQLSPFQF